MQGGTLDEEGGSVERHGATGSHWFSLLGGWQVLVGAFLSTPYEYSTTLFSMRASLGVGAEYPLLNGYLA